MDMKELLKSPIYIMTLLLCLCFAIAFLFCTFWQNDDDTQIKNDSLNLVYNSVFKDFNLNSNEVISFTISYNKETDSGDACIYQVSITFDEEVKNFIVTLFSDGTTTTIENSENSFTKIKTFDNTAETVNKRKGESEYADINSVKEYVLIDAQLSSEDVTFNSIEIDEYSDPAMYEVVFETNDKYRKFIYHVNALNGLLRDRTYYNADDVWDEENIFLNDESHQAKYFYTIWDNIMESDRGKQSFYDAPIYPESYYD